MCGVCLPSTLLPLPSLHAQPLMAFLISHPEQSQCWRGCKVGAHHSGGNDLSRQRRRRRRTPNDLLPKGGWEEAQFHTLMRLGEEGEGRVIEIRIKIGVEEEGGRERERRRRRRKCAQYLEDCAGYNFFFFRKDGSWCRKIDNTKK